MIVSDSNWIRVRCRRWVDNEEEDNTVCVLGVDARLTDAGSRKFNRLYVQPIDDDMSVFLICCEQTMVST